MLGERDEGSAQKVINGDSAFVPRRVAGDKVGESRRQAEIFVAFSNLGQAGEYPRFFDKAGGALTGSFEHQFRFVEKIERGTRAFFRDPLQCRAHALADREERQRLKRLGRGSLANDPGNEGVSRSGHRESLTRNPRERRMRTRAGGRTDRSS